VKDEQTGGDNTFLIRLVGLVNGLDVTEGNGPSWRNEQKALQKEEGPRVVNGLDALLKGIRVNATENRYQQCTIGLEGDKRLDEFGAGLERLSCLSVDCNECSNRGRERN